MRTHIAAPRCDVSMHLNCPRPISHNYSIKINTFQLGGGSEWRTVPVRSWRQLQRS